MMLRGEVNTSLSDADTPSITGLVLWCYNALQSLTISSCGSGAFVIAPAIIRPLTAVKECRRAAFTQPLKGHEAQRCGVQFRAVVSVNQHDDRNHEV